MAIKLMAVKLDGREGEMRERKGNEGGRHVIRDKEARDSGQLLHFGDFFCIFALSFIKNGTAIHQERQMGN